MLAKYFCNFSRTTVTQSAYILAVGRIPFLYENRTPFICKIKKIHLLIKKNIFFYYKISILKQFFLSQTQPVSQLRIYSVLKRQKILWLVCWSKNRSLRYILLPLHRLLVLILLHHTAPPLLPHLSLGLQVTKTY